MCSSCQGSYHSRFVRSKMLREQVSLSACGGILVVRSLLLARFTRQSRNGILPFSSISTEPSKGHANLVIDFSSLDFFRAFKLFSRLSSRLFSRLFFGNLPWISAISSSSKTTTSQ